MKKLMIITIMVLGVIGARAQQDAEYSMYMFNPQFLNPAYAGSQDAIDLSAIYRHQWVDIEGAPRSFSLGAHSPLKRDQYAVGILLSHDRLGVSKFNSLYGQFAYRPKLNDKLRLALGIQAGFTHYRSDFEDLVVTDGSATDDDLFSTNLNKWLPNVGFGAFLSSKRFYAGISVPHIIGNKLSESVMINGDESVARQFQHYFATVGYVFGKDHSKIKIKPSILMKYVKRAPIDFDVNLSFLFVDRYWLGVSYRTGGNRVDDNRLGRGESLIGMFEMMVTKQLAIGYAYDFTLSSLRDATSGTHEFFIGYRLSPVKDKFINPRYLKFF